MKLVSSTAKRVSCVNTLGITTRSARSPASRRATATSICTFLTPRKSLSTSPFCRQVTTQSEAPSEETAISPQSYQLATRKLPLSCPGCGAPTQSSYPKEAGYYDEERAAVRRFLHPKQRQPWAQETAEANIVRGALANIPPELRAQFGLDGLESSSREKTAQLDEPITPICDRCHLLIHHHTGAPILHPSLYAIEQIIADSPHKRNHVYQVIDAADFPMSLIPSLHRRLDFGFLRSRNRRAKTERWSAGRSGEMSFIITRSDLLAPKKEQVDRLMPQLREILRDALGKDGGNARLGDVRLVSSKRGWWTKDVKESVWTRGGANWLVGKANVGKSNVFEVIYPKGTNEAEPNFDRVRDDARKEAMAVSLSQSAPFKPVDSNTAETKPTIQEEDVEENSTLFDPDSLLPPPQPEVNFPVMPVISSLPGTTASPIRIPFGKGKGELIDLPGLERRDLAPYVKPENQRDLVMTSRITPERIVLKSGSSLLLGGGLVRITPKTPDTTFLAHAFVPLSAHVTSTRKAEELEKGERQLQIPSITNDGKVGTLRTAGVFRLQDDVTKKYAGPLTRRDAVGLQASKLPFVVWATDILIEGCGWVEIVAQVRKPKFPSEVRGDESQEPEVRGDESQEPEEKADMNTSTVEPTEVGKRPDIDSFAWSPMDGQGEPLSHSADHPTPSPPPQENSQNADQWSPITTLPPAARAKPTSMPDARFERKLRRDTQEPLDLPPSSLAQTMPEIEVFSPEGRCIGQRSSLSCWLLGGPKTKSRTRRMARPRKSMKGVKKELKRRARLNPLLPPEFATRG